MSDNKRPIDWRNTTFDGSRRDQLRQAQAMTVRQRLEALDQLTELSERIQAMPRQTGIGPTSLAVQETRASYDAGKPVNEIVLPGCTPTPLANYLKALGVLRLLSSKYPDTRGFWRGDQFVLRTSLDRDEIEKIFLQEYEPTPVMAPWNGGSGFYYQERKSKEKDPITGKKRKLGVRDQPTSATKTVDAMLATGSRRLGSYRSVLALAKDIVKCHGLSESPENGKRKDDFILSLRANLPESCLQWIDASLVITSDRSHFPPLLGTGGNDGNLDFSSNFMQRLIDVIGTTDESLPEQSGLWLRTCLFGSPSPSFTKNNIGQFSPGQAGGPNAGTGFEADASINPWDFVLMIEGALLFAAAIVRRNAEDPFGVLSYPFTVRTVGSGSGSLGEGDTANARGELWMPLWSQPATYPEIRALMAEGRVALGRKPAKDALDFVRAVHHLGGYRGIRSFQRFGLLMRSGKAYLATPLARVEVSDEPKSQWLDDLDRYDWLNRFRRFAQGDSTANRFLMLRKRLDDMLFALSGRESVPAEAQALLVLLGEIESALSNSHKGRVSVNPVSRLSEQWVMAADDGTPTFHIAKALAGLQGVGDQPLPLRAQLFPVHRKFDQWMTPDAGEKVRIYTGRKGRLVNNLFALLERRLWLAGKLEMRDKPLDSPAGVSLDDIVAFLHDDGMDGRIAALLPGLSLCKIPKDVERSAGEGTLPVGFGLLKLALTPNRTLHALDVLPESIGMPIPAGMLAQLAAGNHDNRAVRIAWRRLHASGAAPAFSTEALPRLGGIAPYRAAAALLIPLRFGATGALARSVLKMSEHETEVV